MLASENADVAVSHMMQCATVIMLMWLCTVRCSVADYGTGHVPVLCDTVL